MNILANQSYPQTAWRNFISVPVLCENSCHKHCPKEKPKLFSAYDMDGTEIEVLDFLYAFVRMVKPMRVLETGTWKAYGTIALATAIRDNGFGHLTSLEVDTVLAKSAANMVQKLGMQSHVKVVCSPSLEYLSKLATNKSNLFDFSFFDSTRPDRPKEFELLVKRNLINRIACFHDTSRLRIENHKGKDDVQHKYIKELDRLQKKYAKGALEFALSRGLRIFQL